MKYFLLIPSIAFAFNASFLSEVLSDKQLNTKTLMISHKGSIIYKRFSEGDKDTKHLIWSMSKSITSLLFGIAESKSLINKDDIINTLFKTKHDYSLKNLLQMTSGIDWKEIYDKSPFNSDVVRMLYLERKKSVKNYVLSLEQVKKGGELFRYSSGDTNLLSAAIAKKIDSNLKASFPWKWLFDPLGIDATFERDKEGTFMGSSYVYISSESLVKIGRMMLSGGLYEGSEVVPSKYIEFATTISDASKKKCVERMTYGAHIWLNQKCEGRTPLKDVPESTYAFLGYGGQNLFIVPDLELVILRLAEDNGPLDLNKYVASIIKGLQ